MSPSRFLDQLDRVEDLLSNALSLTPRHSDGFPPTTTAHWHTFRAIWPSKLLRLSTAAHRRKLLSSIKVIRCVTLIVVFRAQIIRLHLPWWTACAIRSLSFRIARASWCSYVACPSGWSTVITRIGHPHRLSEVRSRWPTATCSTPTSTPESLCNASLHVATLL